MQIIDLQGKSHKINIRPSKNEMRNEAACRSKLQYQTGQYLREKYPFDPILEDYLLVGYYFDFFLPKRKMAVEIQGIQHDEFVPFFHKTKAKFKEAQIRDAAKQQLCDINGIKLYLIREAKELEWIK